MYVILLSVLVMACPRHALHTIGTGLASRTGRALKVWTSAEDLHCTGSLDAGHPVDSTMVRTGPDRLSVADGRLNALPASPLRAGFSLPLPGPVA